MSQAKFEDDKTRDKLKPRIPVKTAGEELDLARLSKVHPMVPNINMTKIGNSTWAQEERHKRFNYWFDRATRQIGGRDQLKHRCEAKMGRFREVNPLTVADDYLPITTVEDQKLEADIQKAQLVSDIPRVPTVQRRTWERLGYLLMVGAGCLAIAYIYGKWAKKI